MVKPKRLESPNLENVYSLIEQLLDKYGTDEYHDDLQSDYEHYIYEEVMTALYGDAVWEYMTSMYRQ